MKSISLCNSIETCTTKNDQPDMARDNDFRLVWGVYQGIANITPPVKLISADLERKVIFFQNLSKFLDFGL